MSLQMASSCCRVGMFLGNTIMFHPCPKMAVAPVSRALRTAPGTISVRKVFTSSSMLITVPTVWIAYPSE